MGFRFREDVLTISARRNRWRALGANPQILATNDMQEGVYAKRRPAANRLATPTVAAKNAV